MTRTTYSWQEDYCGRGKPFIILDVLRYKTDFPLHAWLSMTLMWSIWNMHPLLQYCYLHLRSPYYAVWRVWNKITGLDIISGVFLHTILIYAFTSPHAFNICFKNLYNIYLSVSVHMHPISVLRTYKMSIYHFLSPHAPYICFKILQNAEFPFLSPTCIQYRF